MWTAFRGETRFDSGKTLTRATQETSQSAQSALDGFVTPFRGAKEHLLSRGFLVVKHR